MSIKWNDFKKTSGFCQCQPSNGHHQQRENFKAVPNVSCTGKSSNLDARECAAWVDFFDSTGMATGEGEYGSCPQNRLDPCACATPGGGAVMCSPDGKSITELDLAGFGLSGTIPDSIGDLKKLNLLQLSDNFLSGTLPDSITSLPSLTDLDLAWNQFSGEISNISGPITSPSSTCSLAPQNYAGGGHGRPPPYFSCAPAITPELKQRCGLSPSC